MKKSLLGLMAISLIITGGLTYADNEFIVHDTTGGTITVYSQDKSYGITIQDKNLGATVVGTGETSYGYYYQWGNNHGNYAGTNTGTLNELLDADVSQWVNKGYSGDNDKFIIFNIINYNKSTYDYRSGVYYTNATDNSYVGDSAYNNLRGGGNDNQTGDATIVKGYDIENHVVINPENRQGPCPSGYHIPSAGEWQELMMLRCNANSGTCNSNTIKTDTNIEKARANYLSRNGIGTTFSNDLWLPLVGYRDYYDGDVGGQGDYARYRSSSPRGGSGPKYAWSLSFDAGGVYPSNTNGRANGQSVRCFKNPDVFTVSFLDDGEVVTSGSIVSGGTWDEIIPTPSEKDGYHFDYRYADGESGAFNFTERTITSNLTLHAHRTLTATVPNGIYTMDNGDITIIRNDIGLTIAGNNLEGNYYRGFNYNTYNSMWSGVSGLGTYIGEDGKMYGNTYQVNNARGGGGDTYDNGFDDGNERYKRQGPCPAGYHMPSRGERNTLAIARCNIDENCDVDTDIITSKYAGGNPELIYIYNSSKTLGSFFRNIFGTYCLFRSSSPYPEKDNDKIVRIFNCSYESLEPDFSSNRLNRYIYTRCFKNYTTSPQVFTIALFDENKYVWSGGIVSGDKIPAEIISGYNLTGLTKEGYTFSGWGISGTDEKFDVVNDTVTTGMILNAVRQINQYTITFDTDGGNNIPSITADYGTGITAPANPTKNGYTFKGWDKPIPSTMPAENMTIKAIWEKVSGGSSGGGGGGGGGGSSSKTDTGSASSGTGNQIDSNTGSTTSGTNEKGPETTTGNKAEIETGSQQPLNPTDSSPNREQTVTPLIGGDGEARGGGTQTYTQEFQEAYEFAHEKGITTMPTINDANMDGKLTRIAMAKMLSQYAINVLGKTPDTSQSNKFNDVTDKLDSDYDDGVTLAYQLGIMGQNMPGNNFRPDDEVTRAEFATALSRMIYGTSDGVYKSTDKYYTNHMSKLVKEGIITKDDPKMKELRGYVMIMLMRSAK